MSKHEREQKRPILLHLRCSKAFVTFVVSFATFTLWQDVLLYGLIVPVAPTALYERVGLSEKDGVWSTLRDALIFGFIICSALNYSIQEQEWTSILLALYAAALLAASPISGYLADRIESRRWPLLIGLVAVGASTALLCAGTTIGHWVVGRLFQGISAAVVWTVGQALLVDSIEKEALGEAMGYAAMGITLGTMTGPLLGGAIYENGGYYAVFGVAFGLIGFDFFLRLALIEKKDALKWLHTGDFPGRPLGISLSKQPTDGRLSVHLSGNKCDSDRPGNHDTMSTITARDDAICDASRQSPHKRGVGAIAALLGSSRMVVTLWGYFVVSVVLTSLDSVLPLFVKDTFGWKQTAQGLIFIPVSVPHILDPLCGYINDKFPHARRFIAAGALLSMSPSCVLLRLITTDSMSQKVVLCVLLALIGHFLAFLIPLLFAEVSYIVQEKEAELPDAFGRGGAMALAYGILNAAFAAGSIVGPFLAGFIREKAGWSTMAWVLGLLTGLSSIPILLFLGGYIWRPTGRAC